MRSVPVLLDDMCSHAKLALELLEGFSEQSFLNDKRTQLAVFRCLEIIGEAAARIPRH